MVQLTAEINGCSLQCLDYETPAERFKHQTGKPMKINITKKEYRLLLDMLYLSDWMMNAHATDPEDYHNDHRALRKRFLSYYKEMDATDIIEYSKEMNDYYELRNYDDDIHAQFIEPFEDETFWEELIDRLAKRDLIKAVGKIEYESMDGMDRVMQLEKAREKYSVEFAAHGLDHLSVKNNSIKG